MKDEKHPFYKNTRGLGQGHVFGYDVPSRDSPLVVLPERPQIVSIIRLRRCGVVQVQLYDELMSRGRCNERKHLKVIDVFRDQFVSASRT